jgi:ribosomal protein L17
MDHRAVPLEVLRDVVRSLTEQASIRSVAEDAGVSRSAVHKFITAGTTPHPRVRRLLALWYLRQLAGLNEVDFLRPYVTALDVLLSDATVAVRELVTMDLLAAIVNRSAEAGEQPPAWVGVMRDRATRSRPVL